MDSDKPLFTCGWFDCSSAAEKGAIFGKRIFSPPRKAGEVEALERRNLCKSHLIVVHGTYLDISECEPDQMYAQKDMALAAPA